MKRGDYLFWGFAVVVGLGYVIGPLIMLALRTGVKVAIYKKAAFAVLKTAKGKPEEDLLTPTEAEVVVALVGQGAKRAQAIIAVKDAALEGGGGYADNFGPLFMGAAKRLGRKD